MNKFKHNPFSVIKASDYTDQEISRYWVDLPEDGFESIIKPTSQTPMIIKGGKGSGKTHLMRYFSFHTQKLRYQNDNILRKVQEDGYCGLYLKCSGLNTRKFQGKGKSEDEWELYFNYYFDLWVAQMYLEVVNELTTTISISAEVEKCICAKSLKLFNRTLDLNIATIEDLIHYLTELQNNIDYQVRNIFFNNEFKIEVLTGGGKLIFGIPKVVNKHIPDLENILFVLLIDEYENFTKNQQIYVQSLMRERDFPISIKVGVRNYGLKTYQTFSDGEHNREGDEFEKISLDDQLRGKSDQYYRAFAENLCISRLRVFGFAEDEKVTSFASFLESPEVFKANEPSSLFTSGMNGKATKKFLNKLEKNSKSLHEFGVHKKSQLIEIVNLLCFENYPILEKLSHFLFYKAWSEGESNLIESAKSINQLITDYLVQKDDTERVKNLLNLHKGSLVAQLNRDHKQGQQYAGFETIVRLSKGFPRHLLTIMRHIYDASIFNGQKPFEDDVISCESQLEGIKQSSAWFYDESRAEGTEGKKLKDAISNLAELFRIERYSDKPIESSLTTFYVDRSTITEKSLSMLKLATDWSLLIEEVSGRKDKTSGQHLQKYRLNAMLSPVWGLPISMRGVIKLDGEVINSIFDPDFNDYYRTYRNKFFKSRNAPFNKGSKQDTLF